MLDIFKRSILDYARINVPNLRYGFHIQAGEDQVNGGMITVEVNDDSMINYQIFFSLLLFHTNINGDFSLVLLLVEIFSCQQFTLSDKCFNLKVPF